MQHTIDQSKDKETRLNNTIAECESTISRLTIQNSQLKTELYQKASQQIPSREEDEEFTLLGDDFQSSTPPDKQRQSPQWDTAYNTRGEGFSTSWPLAQNLQKHTSAQSKRFQHQVNPIPSRPETAIHDPLSRKNVNKQSSSIQMQHEASGRHMFEHHVENSAYALLQSTMQQQSLSKQGYSQLSRQKPLSPTMLLSTEKDLSSTAYFDQHVQVGKKEANPETSSKNIAAFYSFFTAAPMVVEQTENDLWLRSKATPQPTSIGQHCEKSRTFQSRLQFKSDYQMERTSRHL